MTKVIKMLKLLLISAAILIVCVVLLSLTILFRKNGRFPNTHVSGSKAMRKRGIGCVQSQDFEMRRENPRRISEKSNS